MHCYACQQPLRYGACPAVHDVGPPCDRNWRTTPEAQVNAAVRTVPPPTQTRRPLEARLRVHYAL